jgi:flagellin
VTSSNSAAVTVSFNVANASTAAGLAEAVKAFNDVASQTGITASVNSAANGIVLTNSAGDDISLTNTAGSQASLSLAAYDAAASATSGVDTFTAATAAANTGAVVAAHGTLEFNADKGFSLGPNTSAYLAANTSSTLQSVSTIDISTTTGSTRALKIIDSALSAVNSQRATFGALQSRFEQSISNLQTTSENMSAARSRIQDADFAAETANLSRAQILQQAGTAMVAQANQLPQGVLSLLK